MQDIATDEDYSLLERVEAFEDLIDAEVGDTDLTRARNVERRTGLRQLFLKFEGGNPTGTQKDRIAFAQGMDALLQSAINGKNAMPPRGTCGTCSDDDLKAAIEYMVSKVE